MADKSIGKSASSSSSWFREWLLMNKFFLYSSLLNIKFGLVGNNDFIGWFGTALEWSSSILMSAPILCWNKLAPFFSFKVKSLWFFISINLTSFFFNNWNSLIFFLSYWFETMWDFPTMISCFSFFSLVFKQFLKHILSFLSNNWQDKFSIFLYPFFFSFLFVL